MKFFLDTANVEEIRKALRTGLVDGITTNPSLVAKAGRSYRDVLNEICDLVNGPISAEVLSVDAADMVVEAENLAGIHPNIVIKIPMTQDGLIAANALVRQNIPVNMTLIFSPLQALICGKIGVDYVSPFIGRLDDIAHTGMDLVADILTIYENYGFDTEVIVASVRHPVHVVEAARLGAHIATLPAAVFDRLALHPLTDLGMEKFLSDAAKIPRE
ncbi:fructose-6-phosphate aldolase [bacterium]|nr:fructose-6-phosphate aldolase [candidate division CSSED10-310 bacterium]